MTTMKNRGIMPLNLCTSARTQIPLTTEKTNMMYYLSDMEYLQISPD